MKKVILLIFLFLLLVVILCAALMQTPFAQENLRGWIEQKSQGSLKIGKIEGLLPFWFKLHDVHYLSDTTTASIDEATLLLSPTSLILGRISLLQLHIDHASLKTASGGAAKWPTFPLPIYIHALQIDRLDIDKVKGLSLSGTGELSDHLSFDINLTYADYNFRIGIENQRVVIQVPKQGLWVYGIYDWKSGSLAGELHGEKIHNTFTYNEGVLTLQNGGETLTYNLTTHAVEGKGEYSFKGELLLQPTPQLNLYDIMIEGPNYEVFPTAQLGLKGEIREEKFLLNGALSGLGEMPLTVHAEIPFDKSAPLLINLKGKGVIDPLLAYLENASLIAKGDIDMDLSITGSWENPRVTGGIIYEGSVESLATGAIYRDIHMELKGEERSLKIVSLITHDFDRGDLSGTGSMTWDPDQGFPFEFKIYTHRYTLLALDPLTANVDAEFTISGNMHEVYITGDATIVEGHLAIPNKMPTQLPTLEVIYVNPLPTPKIAEEKKTIPVHWDVTIDIPRNLTIEGGGLVSEWRGDLHLSGLQDQLIYSGRLKLVGGRFTIVGRTFDLTEGKIQIKGVDPDEIFVDMKGDLELASITASLLVMGSLDATHVSFSSNPPMSTNQILSWILFNQDVNELTPFQACRLANVLVTLSGRYAGPGLFNNIKQGLGIDVFDITNCDIDSGGLTFQIGKYISQGTFVGVNKSLSGDFDSILIQTRLYRNFYLEADYGGSLNSLTPSAGKMIFKWYKSY